MKPPRILLLSSTMPGPNGVGGIILNDLCNMYPKDSICAFIVTHAPGSIAKPKDLLWLPYQEGKDCMWPLKQSRFGKIGKVTNWVKQSLNNSRCINKMVIMAAKFGRQQRVEQLWVVLDAPASIRMTLPLSRALDVPYSVTVWDDVQHNLSYFGVDRLSRKYLVQEYAEVLKKSNHCAVIGETMKEHYDHQYGTNAIIVRHGIAAGIIQQPIATPSSDGPVIIGFVGSVTARTAFQTLVKAFDLQGWKLGSRNVILRLAGSRFNLACSTPAHIEYRGWLSVQASVAMLAECDINYLPQPFEPAQQSLAMLSFPTKLTTYLAAGRPILLHSTKSSSLYRFIKKHPFGIWNGELNPTSLTADLLRLLHDSTLYNASVKAGRFALSQEFTTDQFRSAFARFMDVDKSLLETSYEPNFS